jgi:hypothetical protein
VIAILRFVGIINAAIWFGAAIFFTVAVGPAFFSPEMKTLLGLKYSGAAAQIVLHRYFILHQCCGVIAIIHLVTEWLYTGKPFDRLSFTIVIIAFLVGVVSGNWMEPNMKHLHFIKYTTQGTQSQDAARTFGILHGISQSLNLVSTVGLLFFLWRVTSSIPPLRFVGSSKFRG